MKRIEESSPNLPISASRRQMMTAVGVSALAIALFSPAPAIAVTNPLTKIYRDRIKLLRKSKRKARRIKSPIARRNVIRSLNKQLRDTRRLLRQSLQS